MREDHIDAATGVPLVEVAHVSKSFATDAGTVKALDDMSLKIWANEFFTLLGPSGCGKSTLLRLLAGFEHPDAGAVLLEGASVGADPPNKRPVNIVFQSYALFPHMSVGQNVAFGLERQGLPRRDVAARVAAMLALVRLDDMAARTPAQLSGGQQQRVALARALAPKPKLLLLDEPLSALDRKLRRGMQVELKRLQRETGITFLLVTHDQEEALSMSDRIAVMDAGRVLQVGTPREIYEAPRARFVADFMGANILPGALVGSAAAYVAIRPERIVLAADRLANQDLADHDLAGQDLPGRVKETNYLGPMISYVILLDAGPIIKVDGDAGTSMIVDQPVVCRFPAAALAALEV